MPKACNLQKGHVVSINDQPYQVKAIKVHTPSARGANTLYKVRFNCVSTGQKLDQTLKGNDLLEEVGGYGAGAGCGEEHPLRLQQLEGKQVDILVGPGRPLDVALGASKLGRIQYDEVEAASLAAVAAQDTESIAIYALEAVARDVVERSVALCQGQGSSR